MASLEQEEIIFTTARGSALDSKLSRIDVDQINVVDIDVSGTINDQSIVGDFVFTTAEQTLTNKSLEDDTCAIVDPADATIKVKFDAAGATATTATLRFAQTANRTYTVPDSGASCSIVTTEGAQTVNGTKIFTDLQATSFSVDAITEVTTDHGIYIDNIRLREDTIVTPSMTLASITPVGAATHITVAIIPKGNGAIIADVPDNASTGGNIRGTNAVDLQSTRADAAQVASGTRSGILCGESNTASGTNSVVCGGSTNSNSGITSFIGGGTSQTVSADYSGIVYGTNCTVSAQYSYAGGRQAKAVNAGVYVIADSTASDFSSTATDQYNARFSNGYRLTGGKFSLNDKTTVYSSGTGSTVGATTADIYTLATATNTVYLYTARIIASTSAGDAAVFVASVKVKNIAGTLTVGTMFDIWSDNDATISSAAVSFVASGTNVLVQATGVAAQTISWSGETTETLMSI